MHRSQQQVPPTPPYRPSPCWLCVVRSPAPHPPCPCHQVEEVTYVTGDAKLVTITQASNSSAMFDLTSSYGTMGIVVEVVLKVQPLVSPGALICCYPSPQLMRAPLACCAAAQQHSASAPTTRVALLVANAPAPRRGMFKRLPTC